MGLTVLMILVFLFGIFLIAVEEKIHINKSAIALLMSVALWLLLVMSGVEVTSAIVDHQLGEVSETLFFVMGALVIVELIDVHGGFRVISSAITTKNKRKLLWIVSFLTFFISALLDNIATAVIMVALLRKFVPLQRERWLYAGMVIIAANAGGSFSPVGDVTTILLWTGGNLSALHQIGVLILPALTCLIVPLIMATFWFKKTASLGARTKMEIENSQLPEISHRSRLVILVLGVATMALVPVFQDMTSLPPFIFVLMGLAVLWAYTDTMYGKINDMPEGQKLRVNNVLSRIDMSTILFFLGILMSVGALKVAGALTQVGDALETSLGEPLLISFVIGVMSSFVDNVALVAATQGMYPIAEAGTYMANSEFWTFLAYCAVTGGSLLIIGSATGVTVMGLEKLTFGYYLKRFSLLALAGYIAGAGVYLLIG